MNRILACAVATAFLGANCIAQSRQTSVSDSVRAGIGSAKEMATKASVAAAKRAYQELKKHGQPMAEKLLKSAGKAYSDIPKQLQSFSKRVMAAKSIKDLGDTMGVVLELWKLRSAVDVLALANPQVVQALTGLDPDRVKTLTGTMKIVLGQLRKFNLV
jgi:hypothetical protein